MSKVPRFRVSIYRKSTVPKNVRGRFFDTNPAIWTKRRLCRTCTVRPCVVPALVEAVIFPDGRCHHCICWDPNRHCCWCGVSHHGARMADIYQSFIERLKELGCRYCEECHNYVSIPHALHPAVNPKPITNRNRKETSHGDSRAAQQTPRPGAGARKRR